MKRLSLIVFLILLAILTACSTREKAGVSIEYKKVYSVWGVDYNGGVTASFDGRGLLNKLLFFDTYEKLNSYIEENSETATDQISYNSIQYLKLYEADFFEEKSLIFMIYTVSSGSYSVSLSDIKILDGGITVYLKSPKINGDSVTCDCYSFGNIIETEKCEVNNLSHKMIII